MSLKVFHVLFICLSIVVTLGFGAWAIATRLAGASGLYLATTVISLAIGVALIGYGGWVIQKFRTFPASKSSR